MQQNLSTCAKDHNANVGQGLAPAAQKMLRLYRNYRRIRNLFRADGIRPYGEICESMRKTRNVDVGAVINRPRRESSVYNETTGEFVTFGGRPMVAPTFFEEACSRSLFLCIISYFF